MSTALSSKHAYPDPLHTPDRNIVIQEKMILDQLTDEMELVQKRLGTTAEQTGDCQLARDLGHAIRNKLHVLCLWESLEPKKESRHNKPRDLQHA